MRELGLLIFFLFIGKWLLCFCNAFVIRFSTVSLKVRLRMVMSIISNYILAYRRRREVKVISSFTIFQSIGSYIWLKSSKMYSVKMIVILL